MDTTIHLSYNDPLNYTKVYLIIFTSSWNESSSYFLAASQYQTVSWDYFDAVSVTSRYILRAPLQNIHNFTINHRRSWLLPAPCWSQIIQLYKIGIKFGSKQWYPAKYSCVYRMNALSLQVIYLGLFHCFRLKWLNHNLVTRIVG